MRYWFCRSFLLLALLLAGGAAVQAADNLLPDPSVERTRPRTQFGIPYEQWGGWVFEGACEFRNGKVARTGDTSAEMVAGQSGKIRLYTPAVTVEPGRYRFSCYIRGLDVGPGLWGTCEDVNFADEQYHPMKKSGTFGWTRLEIVKDVPARQEIVARVGLWGPGRLWVDDAEIVRVPADTPLTDGPALGEEERPIAPPEPPDNAQAVRCPDCGYRNLAAWQKCYACGESLTAQAQTASGPAVRTLHSFEEGTIQPLAADAPESAVITGEHATEGKSALRLKKGYVSWDGPQDWTGYDFFKADAFNSTGRPVQLYFEVQDKSTTDYWTRVNYTTVIPPGKSVLIIPTDLYVGEKSRPGRPLDLANIKRVVLSIGENRTGAVDFDHLRLERDLSDSVKVPGLMAFSFGPGTSRPLRGFTQVTPATQYSPGRGYGLKNAQIFRAYDALQPDPLYQTGIIIQNGGFAIDLPDGKYHVFVNLDSPSGFWGEYQVYRERIVKANGIEVVHDRMDLPAFLKKYYRFADVEDSPEENTFDKYQEAYFREKEFDVEVKGGQLFLEFIGEAWANYVSALVVYPAEQSEAGRKYLDNLSQRRRFYFDNYFKRVLPDGLRDAKGAIPPLKPTPGEQSQGYVLFARDWMDDVPVNAVPRREEVARKLSVFASAGQKEPVVFSIHSLKNLGPVKVSATDLIAPSGKIPASAIQAGVVSHRLSRVTMEGTVYTIAPRLIMPRSSATLRKGVSTTFWLTLNAPGKVKSGVYKGRILLTFADGRKDAIDLTARLFARKLDELDVPAGPWGSAMPLPWYEEDTGGFNRQIFKQSLAKMRSYGCTTFSGIPTLRIRGWQNGKPDIDFTRADQEMADARAAGFKQIVVNYNGGILGFNNYFIDEAAMQSAGFTKYTDFLRAVLTEVDAHARSAGWLPVAYNLCDEPIKDDVPRAAANARAWREAAPPALYTTGATSMENPQPDEPHLPLARALKIANLNLHDEKAIRLIHEAGSDWAFYNGGNRWTFGAYMYKCAKDYNMKFRISWHWNACAGDPYYALDCREDDYAWCVTNAKMEMIPSLHFERDIRAGIQDYRYMLTLSRLLSKRPNHPAAPAARRLLKDKLASFKLGERDHDAKWPMKEYHTYRLSLAEAIEKLSR